MTIKLTKAFVEFVGGSTALLCVRTAIFAILCMFT